jgi:hypothetical protein
MRSMSAANFFLLVALGFAVTIAAAVALAVITIAAQGVAL